MHDDAFQVTYHPRGKIPVLQNSTLQSAKSEIASKPHQSVKMQHSTAICLNHAEMIRNLSQDSDAASIRAEKPIKYAFTGVVEELGNSNWIRRCCRLPDGCICSREGVSGILNAGQQ
jgi:hypothetical protein